MSTKKEYTLEELEAQYKKIEESQKVLKAQIDQKKKEEKELREAKLAMEKDARKAELDDAFKNYKKLLKAYINDYGIYSCTITDDIFSSKFWNQIF